MLSISCKNKHKLIQNSLVLKDYISAYTTGEVSRSSAIVMQFTNDAIPVNQIGQELESGIFSFEPQITGTASWIDTKTVKFIPKDELEPETVYVGTFKMGKIFKTLPKDAQEFNFDFRVKEQFVTISCDPAVYSYLDNNTLNVEGSFETNDLAKFDEVKKCLVAKYRSKEVSITWASDKATDKASCFKFSVNKLEAPENNENLEFIVNGKPIGAKNADKKMVVIPSSKGFNFVDKLVKNVPDQVIKLYFNTPIDTKQDLAGLVSFSNNATIPSIDVESNVLMIYPEDRLIGSYTINVNKGLKNMRGEMLSEDKSIEINFEDLKPAVRLENNNMILPNADKLYLPFEAVSLKAVDVEIFKIYNNNVLQYLQTEGNDDYNLNRVGKIILQKKITLENEQARSNTQGFKKYSIDLATIIKPEPNALYQVRIGFKPEYSTYSCSEPLVSNSKEDFDRNNDTYYGMGAEFDDGEFTSIMNNYYGYDGYYEDYQWTDRDDPCKQAYFNSSRFKSCILLSSNIGLIAKSGNGGEVMVISTDLNTTAPLSGVELQFYDFQSQLIQSAKTNSEGIGMASFKRKPFAVIASLNGQKSYLRLWDNESLNISQFDVVGEDIQRGMKGFLYGERGVWRPGDSLYLNFMLDARGKTDLPADLPISFELYDPKSVLQYSTISTQNINQLYPLYTATRQDALTGNWKVVVKAGGANFVFPLKIEAIKPNRMKLKLDFGKKEISASDEPVGAILSASWLYGAPAKNLKAKVDLSMWQLKDKFPKFPDYQIYNERSSPSFTPDVWFEGQLNEVGEVKIRKQLLPRESNATGPMIANFKIRVFEQGGESSQDNFSIKYHPFEQYCGVSVLKNSYGHPTFGINQNVPISVASISKDGQPIQGKQLSVEIFKVEWSWWWDEAESYYRNYEQADAANIKDTRTLSTNSAGKAGFNFKTAEWGRYYVQVTDKNSGHVSGEYFYCGYPESDDDYLARRAASIVPVMSNKEDYVVGETVKLKLNCPDKGRVLISLENGSRVVKTIWKDAKKGDNEFSFEATADLSPNVYANVSIIQQFGQNVNDLPVRMYGIIPIKVEDKNTRLKPEIQMANELKPGMKSSITIKEASGKSMAYTIDIVDEGLLDLTRFNTPDPWKKFYAREALGVKTWDLFDRLIGAYSQEGSQILSIGGDAGKAPNPDKQKAIRFKPMVIHLGPFYLEKGRSATHNFTVPNYIGSVRTMVVASNKGAYGNAEKTIPVRSPVMVLASFPRVVGPGEIIKVPVNVFTTDNKVKSVAVNITDQSGLIRNATNGSQNLSFTKPDEKVVYFDLVAGNVEGIAKIKINAAGNGENSNQDIEVDVRNSNPVQTSVMSAIVKDKGVADFKIEPIGIKGTNTTTLEISSLPPINLQKNLQYLINYPHGCLEQTVSSAFPQIYLANIVKLTPKQQIDTEKNIKAAIDKLKKFVTSEGGFNYWPGGTYVNHWANNYAGHFLIEAKNAGYNVPQSIFESWLKYEKKLAKNWSPTRRDLGYYNEESNSIQAYRLYLLALVKSADKGAMNRMRESTGLDRESAVFLAAAYALDGKTELASKILDGNKVKPRHYEYSGYTFGSDLRDKAILFDCLQLTGREKESADIFASICKEIGQDNYYYSTQTLSFTLASIGRYLGKNHLLGKELKFSYSLDGKKEMTVSSKEPVILIQLPTSQVSSSNLKIKNLQAGLLYAKVVKSGKPANGKELEEAKNLVIDMNFKDLKGNKIDPQKMKRGNDFIVEIMVKNPGTLNWKYTNMALTQIFPPGWEITNSRMSNVNYVSNQGSVSYQDFKDDRVLSYFDLPNNNSTIIRIQLTAAYPGKYYLPGTQCEAMYDNIVYARKKGTWVTVL